MVVATDLCGGAGCHEHHRSDIREGKSEAIYRTKSIKYLKVYREFIERLILYPSEINSNPARSNVTPQVKLKHLQYALPPMRPKCSRSSGLCNCQCPAPLQYSAYHGHSLAARVPWPQPVRTREDGLTPCPLLSPSSGQPWPSRQSWPFRIWNRSRDGNSNGGGIVFQDELIRERRPEELHHVGHRNSERQGLFQFA